MAYDAKKIYYRFDDHLSRLAERFTRLHIRCAVTVKVKSDKLIIVVLIIL